MSAEPESLQAVALPQKANPDGSLLATSGLFAPWLLSLVFLGPSAASFSYIKIFPMAPVTRIMRSTVQRVEVLEAWACSASSQKTLA